MGRFPEGSHFMRLAPGSPASEVSMEPKFFAVADPRISFDASRLLYSGQQKKDGDWQVWEAGIDGSEPRQITHCIAGCVQPVYLPHNQIAYTSLIGNAVGTESAVYVCNTDGTRAHRITFGPGDYQVETVLHDGRLLLAADSVGGHRPVPHGGSDGGYRALYTIRPDGSGLTLLRQNASASGVTEGATELADGAIVFIQRKHLSGAAPEGELQWLRPGALRASGAAQKAPADYESAAELQEGTLLVAERELHASGHRFGLYTFDLASRTRGELLYLNPRASSVQAVAVRSYAAPEYYWTILHPEVTTGRLLCLNSYASQDGSGGRLAGHIAQVRVIALNQSSRREDVLGKAPVEADGSFYVTVPADMPVRFELLDAKGGVIHKQTSWIWARNGEDRGCLGCHESNAMAPENHWPRALRRLDTPTPLAAFGHSSSQHPQGIQ